MTLYRKVFTKDRLPEKLGYYDTPEGRIGFAVGLGWQTKEEPNYWLEEIDLGDLQFTKEDATPDFVDGINYILNKLKV